MRNESEETLEELRPGGLRILQKKRGFRFGLEAVLLADFARAPAGARVADLGTGTGVLPLLMIERGKGAAFDALERDPDMAEMAGRTMALNGLAERVRVPVLAGLQAGHTGDQKTLCLGRRWRLDADACSLTLAD